MRHRPKVRKFTLRLIDPHQGPAYNALGAWTVGLLRRWLTWLRPGMKVKRWTILIALGLALTSLGGLLLANIFAYELTAAVGGPVGATFWGAVVALCGLGLVVFGIRGLIRSIAGALVPHSVDRLADYVWRQRRLESGLRVVAIGGGTVLSNLLRGLKRDTTNITAIAAVSDSGGSSGLLREDMGVPAPGDVRNCLAALADSEQLMARVLQYRFNGEVRGLSGHSLGNLLIAALTDILGDFDEAVRQMHEILAIRGRVLPPTVASVTLCARLESGEIVRGEHEIGRRSGIVQVFLDPPDPPALPEAIQAIEDADLVVIGPGSLYTSVLANLLVPGIADALRRTSALRVYVCNVMTQPGETDGYTVADHIDAIHRHIGEGAFEFVLLNDAVPSHEVLERYRATGAKFVHPDTRAVVDRGYVPIRADLISRDNYARHDPQKLARALVRLAQREMATAI